MLPESFCEAARGLLQYEVSSGTELKTEAGDWDLRARSSTISEAPLSRPTSKALNLLVHLMLSALLVRRPSCPAVAASPRTLDRRGLERAGLPCLFA